jgi:hypothetical protein
MFGFADNAMKRAFDVPDGIWIDIGVREAPRFRPLAQGFAVCSAPIRFADLDVSLTLAGNLDAFVETNDGRRILIDYKTSPGEPGAGRDAGQLDGYAFALENPGPDTQYEATTVDAMALLVFRPVTFVAKPSGLSGLYGRTAWLEIPQHASRLFAMLRRVAALLTGRIMPTPNEACLFCIYYGAAHRTANHRRPLLGATPA